MRRSEDFLLTVRRGRKAGTQSLVVHLLEESDDSTSLVGFVVTKAVGPAVVRSRVKRQLRHLMRDRVVGLAAGSRVVVRALPPAAMRNQADLAVDLDRALSQVAA